MFLISNFPRFLFLVVERDKKIIRKTLEYITFNENDIMEILEAVKCQKMFMSMINSMLKICEVSLNLPLAKKCLGQGKSPKIWKKTNLTQIHKRGSTISLE